MAEVVSSCTGGCSHVTCKFARERALREAINAIGPWTNQYENLPAAAVPPPDDRHWRNGIAKEAVAFHGAERLLAAMPFNDIVNFVARDGQFIVVTKQLFDAMQRATVPPAGKTVKWDDNKKEAKSGEIDWTEYWSPDWD